jgi:hypothetical protein
MPKSRRFLLIALNALVLATALVVIAVLATKPALQSTDSSHAEIIARTQGVADVPRLRAVISRDDEYIRTLEDVVSKSTFFTKALCTLFSGLAALSLTLLFLPQRPKS